MGIGSETGRLIERIVYSRFSRRRCKVYIPGVAVAGTCRDFGIRFTLCIA